jgi:hypothetical protein
VRPCVVSHFASRGEAQPGPAIAVARIGLIGHFGVLPCGDRAPLCL